MPPLRRLRPRCLCHQQPRHRLPGNSPPRAAEYSAAAAYTAPPQANLGDSDSRISGDQFLLDLGSAESPTGYVGAPLFFPGVDCGRLANYSADLGIAELYASISDNAANASAAAPATAASAPVVQERLAVLLPSVCRAVRADPASAAAVDLLAASNTEPALAGLGSEGAFYVLSFLVADRRWAFIVHSRGLAYRTVLATSAPPIVLAVPPPSLAFCSCLFQVLSLPPLYFSQIVSLSHRRTDTHTS